MQTTIELPDALWHEAMGFGQYRSANELVETALRELLRCHKRKLLKDSFGKIDLTAEVDLDALRQR